MQNYEFFVFGLYFVAAMVLFFGVIPKLFLLYRLRKLKIVVDNNEGSGKYIRIPEDGYVYLGEERLNLRFSKEERERLMADSKKESS